jgi:hypothetical protein
MKKTAASPKVTSTLSSTTWVSLLKFLKNFVVVILRRSLPIFKNIFPEKIWTSQGCPDMDAGKLFLSSWRIPDKIFPNKKLQKKKMFQNLSIIFAKRKLLKGMFT